MKIKHTWHLKPGSKLVHAFIPLRRTSSMAACHATRAGLKLAEDTTGPWCQKCVTALARLQVPAPDPIV